MILTLNLVIVLFQDYKNRHLCRKFTNKVLNLEVLIRVMHLACYIKNPILRQDPQWLGLVSSLVGDGHVLEDVSGQEDVPPDTEMILSIGGDGTFLCAARMAVESDVPVLGVNLGRLGFLSENSPSDVARAISSGSWSVVHQPLLELSSEYAAVQSLSVESLWPYALNEISLNRSGSAMIGVDVSLDGKALPTYWADGMLVATSSGSTAYSLSVGGPILTPEVRDLIVAPIAPHNLNLRPLIVPSACSVDITLHSRDGKAMLSLDNRGFEVPDGIRFTVRSSGKALRRVRLDSADFVGALRSRLFWGEDVRNSTQR